MSTAKATKTKAAKVVTVTVTTNDDPDPDRDPTPDEMKKVIKCILQCTICLDTASAPIHNCLNGHIICGLCVKRLSKPKCATCKRKVFVSLLGERISKMVDLTTECPHCSEAISNRKMLEHEESCPKRPKEIKDDYVRKLQADARRLRQLIDEFRMWSMPVDLAMTRLESAVNTVDHFLQDNRPFNDDSDSLSRLESAVNTVANYLQLNRPGRSNDVSGNGDVPTNNM